MALFRAEVGEDMAQLAANGTCTLHSLISVFICSLDIRETLHEVLQLAGEEALSTGCESVVVICGTGYIMPEARSFLGIVEPR